MKTVCRHVYSKYPDFDLSHKKEFIKTTVKSVRITIQTMHIHIIHALLFRLDIKVKRKNYFSENHIQESSDSISGRPVSQNEGHQYASYYNNFTRTT